MTIPYTAMEVNAQRERYRILRVNVMTVVRMYNKVNLLLFHLLDLTPCWQCTPLLETSWTCGVSSSLAHCDKHRLLYSCSGIHASLLR